jgi:hypothetical protein
MIDMMLLFFNISMSVYGWIVVLAFHITVCRLAMGGTFTTKLSLEHETTPFG